MTCSYIPLSKSDEKLRGQKIITGGATAPALEGFISILQPPKYFDQFFFLRGLLVLDPEPKDMHRCHPYYFMKICKPPVNEPIGSYQIHHLNNCCYILPIKKLSQFSTVKVLPTTGYDLTSICSKSVLYLTEVNHHVSSLRLYYNA